MDVKDLYGQFLLVWDQGIVSLYKINQEIFLVWDQDVVSLYNINQEQPISTEEPFL